MTTSNRPAESTPAALLTIGLAAVCGATIIGVLMALPDSQNPATVLTVVIGFLGTMIGVLANNVHGERANKKLDKVLNGTMDQKIRDAVRQVLREEGIINGGDQP